MNSDTNFIIFSVGGSLIVPDAIDTDFLKRFKEHIIRYIDKGFRIVVISGGGKTARSYQRAAQEITDITSEDSDWIGIHSTRLNGHLLRTIFYQYAHPRIIENPNDDFVFNEKILIAAGWRPGRSTDFNAVVLAKKLHARKIINLTNIDYVYTKDPKKFSNAEKIENIHWPEFRKLIPDTWDPGLNSPFDPIAAREAETDSLEVAIIHGHHLEEADKYLEGKPFKGTRIMPK